MKYIFQFLLLILVALSTTNPLLAQWLQSAGHGGYILSRNPVLTIRYELVQRTHVILTLYNTLGRQIVSLVNDEQEAGDHEANLDGSGLASGMYFYRIQAGGFVETKTVLLIH